jgi:hypothetical protein
MTKIETDKALLDALRAASGHVPSADELRRQRVSFIMGMLKEDSTVTRARVVEILKQQEGETESAA